MAYLTQTQTGQPILILKEGASRSRGKQAQRNNIMAAKVIAEAIRSTLGPRGMDKMLVSGIGDITITNDGAAILDEIDVQHPAAKMIVEVAKTQDDMVGDGTTTAVILSGELLEKAEELLEQNIHPTLIVSGYRKAAQKALEVLDKISQDVDLNDKETLKNVARTAMGSKTVGTAREHFADIAIDAVGQIAEKRGEKWVVDIDNVQIIKKAGKSLQATELVNGIILDKEVAHSGMPKSVKKTKIALVNTPLEVKKTEVSAEIRIHDPTQITAFLNKETSMLKKMVAKIKKAKASVLGIVSRDSAKASTASCSLPPIWAAYSRSFLATSVSAAPPPTTILFFLNTSATTDKASCIARSASSTSFSKPARIRIETDFGFLHPSTKTILSSPIFRSSTSSA